MSYKNNLPELNWPLTINELASQERNPPESLLTFLTHLLRFEKHSLTSENLCRLVDSYAADLIHGVTRGAVITSSKSVAIQKGKTVKSADVNPNILAALLAFYIKSGKAIDINKALEFPLSPVPLSIANADGIGRQTAKSKPMQLLQTKMPGNPCDYLNPPKSEVSTYIFDFIALVRTIVEIPSMFEEFALKLLKSIPSGYPRVDFVADTVLHP